jgi:hypothetical protein
LNLSSLLLPLLLLAQVDAARTLPPSPLQLVVERTELAGPSKAGEPPRALDITVFNPGSRTIHGWTVQSMATFADGYTSYGGHGSDSYASSISQEGRSGPVVPGARRTVRTSYGSRSGTPEVPVSFGARVTAVIFDNDVAVGDEKDIQQLFEFRAADQRTWPVVEKCVEDALAEGGEARAVLERILSALRPLTRDAAMGPTARGVVQTLALNLKLALDPAALLKRFVDDVREKRLVTEAHCRRRFTVE